MLYKIELDIKLNFIQFYRGSCTTRLLLSLHASMMASMKVHTAGDHLTTININLCLYIYYIASSFIYSYAPHAVTAFL